MGAGLLAKGLVGVVLPIGVVGFYYLLRRCWPSLWLTLLWGGPTAPWLRQGEGVELGAVVAVGKGNPCGRHR